MCLAGFRAWPVLPCVCVCVCVKPNSAQGECSHVQAWSLHRHVSLIIFPRCEMCSGNAFKSGALWDLWRSFKVVEWCRDSMGLSYFVVSWQSTPLQSSADHQSGGSPPKMPLALEHLRIFRVLPSSSEFFPVLPDSHCRISETESHRTWARWLQQKWSWWRSSW